MPKILQAEIATSFIYAISPSAKVENLPNGRILITITDKEGTTTAQVPVISKEGIENIINEYFQEHPIAEKYIQQHNESASAHQDIRQLIQQAINRIPIKTSQLENNSGFITLSDIPVGPTASTTVPLMDGAASAGSHYTFARGDHRHPSDTSRVPTSRTIAGHMLTDDVVLNKNDIGLNNVDNTADIDKPISTAMQTALDSKVNSEIGKGLSTNDYTDEEKDKLAAFGQASDYALKSDIINVYKYKGSVTTISLLPSDDNITGDIYNVEDSGMNYAWNGTEWDALGEIFTIPAISNNDIDIIMAQ